MDSLEHPSLTGGVTSEPRVGCVTQRLPSTSVRDSGGSVGTRIRVGVRTGSTERNLRRNSVRKTSPNRICGDVPSGIVPLLRPSEPLQKEVRLSHES